MGIMESVMGEVGTGVQPKDNPNPFAPPVDNEAEVYNNSLPQPTPSPQPKMASQPNPFAESSAPAEPEAAPSQPVQREPADPQTQKDNKDIDDLFRELDSSPKEKGVQKSLDDKHSEDIDSLFDQFNSAASKSVFGGSEQFRTDNVDPNAPIIEPKKPGEGYFEWASKALPAQLKFVGAQMRSHLGRDPIEQRKAFESMYGSENVKTIGKDLYFKPEGSEKFRKVDQNLYNSMTDFVLFNALRAVPIAGNVGAQILTDVGSGGLALAASGGVGGAVEGSTRAGMISLIDKFSSQSQKHADDLKETLKDAGLNAFLGPIAGKLAGAIAYPVRKAGSELMGLMGDAFSMGEKAVEGTLKSFGKAAGESIMSAEEKAMGGAGNQISKLAQIRAAFQEFKNQVFPEAMEKYGPAESPTGEVIYDAMDKIHERLGKAVQSIKGESISLAKQQQKTVSMQHTLETVKDTLDSYGVHFDDAGKAQFFEGKGSLLKPEVKSSINELGQFYNRLSDAESGSFGSELEGVYKDIDKLDSLANWEKGNAQVDKTSQAQIQNMFRKVRNSATADRNVFLDDLYSRSQSANKEIWKNSFDKFAQSADALVAFKSSFATPQSRELLVQSLNSAPNAEKLEMLDGLRQVLGSNSKEWGSLKGEMFNDLLNKYSQEGVLNASELIKYMNNAKNSPVVERLFNPREKVVLNKMLSEASRIDYSGTLTSQSKRIIEDGLEKYIDFVPDKKSIVKGIFRMFKGNRRAIDYLTDEGFLSMASRAENPEMKKRIYDALMTMDGLKAKMTLVDVPTIVEKGTKKFTQKYAPYVTAGTSNMINSFLEPYQPEKAPNPPAPIQ